MFIIFLLVGLSAGTISSYFFLFPLGLLRLLLFSLSFSPFFFLEALSFFVFFFVFSFFSSLASGVGLIC